MQVSPGPLYAALWQLGFWEQEQILATAIAVTNKIFFFWPESLMSSANFYETVAAKLVHGLFTVLDYACGPLIFAHSISSY